MTWRCSKKCMDAKWRAGVGARGTPNYVTRQGWVWCGGCELAVHRIYSGTGTKPRCPCCRRQVRTRAKLPTAPSRVSPGVTA